MKVLWTRTAIGRSTSIYEYMARDSVRYAQRTIDRITSRSRQIARFPKSGEVVPEYQDPDVREVLVGQYRMVDEVSETEIYVLAVIHGAHRLPLEPPREPGT